MSADPNVRVEPLRCNGCGAPLSVPESANFVTCQHCRAQLAARRNESAAYTEVLEEFTKQTAELRGQVRKLTLQNELEALDREWERQRERTTWSTRRMDVRGSRPWLPLSELLWERLSSLACASGWQLTRVPSQRDWV